MKYLAIILLLSSCTNKVWNCRTTTNCGTYIWHTEDHDISSIDTVWDNNGECRLIIVECK